MVRWRHVREIKDVRLPREAVGRIHRPGERKTSVRSAASGIDEQLFECRLAIRGIRAEIGEIKMMVGIRRHRMMRRRIYAAVERRDEACAKIRFERVERTAAGETEDQVERCQTVRR